MFVNLKRAVIFVGLLTIGIGALAPAADAGVPDTTRTATKKVKPVYPEMARKVRLAGTVKLTVLITPQGKVKSVEVIGGHPVLVVAATEAARQWQFATAQKESTEILVFEFSGIQ